MGWKGFGLTFISTFSLSNNLQHIAYPKIYLLKPCWSTIVFSGGLDDFHRTRTIPWTADWTHMYNDVSMLKPWSQNDSETFLLPLITQRSPSYGLVLKKLCTHRARRYFICKKLWYDLNVRYWLLWPSLTGCIICAGTVMTIFSKPVLANGHGYAAADLPSQISRHCFAPIVFFVSENEIHFFPLQTKLAEATTVLRNLRPCTIACIILHEFLSAVWRSQSLPYITYFELILI